MSSTVAFLRYELRRHFGPLALGLALLAILPAARRAVTDDWHYWDGAWNVWGAVLSLYVVLPILVLAMAASGWARERAVDTLEWLYARPLGSGAIFAARAAAIAVGALAWAALAVALHGVGTRELGQALSIVPGVPGPRLLFLTQLVLALGAGLFASARAASSESAFRASLLLVAGAWAIALAGPHLVSHREVLLSASRAEVSYLLDNATGAFLLAVGALLAICGWRAIAVAPYGQLRARRTIAAIAGSLALAFTGFTAWLLVPLLTGPTSPHAFWLGDERGLTFAAARGLTPATAIPRGVTIENRIYPRNADTWLFAHPLLRDGNAVRSMRSTFTLRPGPWTAGPWPNPTRGAAVLHRYQGNGWLLLDHEGAAHELPLAWLSAVNLAGLSQAVGWSPGGERFAWTWQWPSRNMADPGEPLRVFVLEPDSEMRTFEAPAAIPVGARAAWMDEETLLVTGSRRRGPRQWAVVDLTSESPSVARPVGDGQMLTAPAFLPWVTGAAALPSLAGRAVAVIAPEGHSSTVLWSRDVGALDRGQDSDDVAHPPDSAGVHRPAPRLVFVDRTALEPGPELHEGLSVASMGNLDDGSLVWAALDRPLGPPEWGVGSRVDLYRLAAPDAAPQLLCTLPQGRVSSFLGQSGPWAIWDTVLFFDYELWGCNLETSEVREITEWEAWAHPLGAVTDRGLWTPEGWVPVGN